MELFKSKTSKIFLGILWGLGLAIIFRHACNKKGCIIYKAPNPIEIKNNIFNQDSKCFSYNTVSVKCTKDTIKN